MALTVSSLYAERDARHRQDEEAINQLHRRQQEELVEYRNRLENFQLTEAIIQSGLDRIKRAFDRGENELMFSSFPSDFCSDGGRAVINAGAAPINKPDPGATTDEPEWLATMPAGVRQVYDYWKANLQPGGFKLIAQIIDFPGGKPGNVGLFFSWPKDTI